jgi:rhamnosyltransferase
MNNIDQIKVALLVPTLDAGSNWATFLGLVNRQGVTFARKIIIDSGSSDNTVQLAEISGFEVLHIKKEDFDHGYSRQLLAIAACECDILIYLTQDCFLKGIDAVEQVLKAFDNDSVGISYGRQLPRVGAKTLETHARVFNYPSKSIIKMLKDKETMGIKTASCSNSFAAYRSKALKDVGGFPKHTIFAEDVIVGGKMLMKGWKISYSAEAEAYHSHNYTILEEFRRYFDIGVYHSTNLWLLEEFGKVDGEGFKYVKSEMAYVLNNNPLVFPKMIASIIAKFIGYKLGMKHKLLSENWRKSFSMHKRYWDTVKTI